MNKINWKDIFHHTPTVKELVMACLKDIQVMDWVCSIVSQYARVEDGGIAGSPCLVWTLQTYFSGTMGLKIPGYSCAIGLDLVLLDWCLKYKRLEVPSNRWLYRICSQPRCVMGNHHFSFLARRGRTVGMLKKRIAPIGLMLLSESQGGMVESMDDFLKIPDKYWVKKGGVHSKKQLVIETIEDYRKLYRPELA